MSRMKSKAKEQLSLHCLTSGSSKFLSNKEVGKHATTRKVCSCHLCGNPRRIYGNSRYAQRISDLRHMKEMNIEA